MNTPNYNVKIDNTKMITTIMENLCTVTKEQVAELIKKQLKRQHSAYDYNEQILMTSIKRLKKSCLYATESILDGKDLIISPFGERGNLPVIPCFWVLQDMFKNEYIDLNNVFRGKNPETMNYSTDNISYSFYFISEDNIGTIRKSIDTALYYKNASEKTRGTQFHLINVYVTDSVSVADTITELTKDIRCRIAVIKTESNRLEKPTDIAYIVDGKRID